MTFDELYVKRCMELLCGSPSPLSLHCKEFPSYVWYGIITFWDSRFIPLDYPFHSSLLWICEIGFFLISFHLISFHFTNFRLEIWFQIWNIHSVCRVPSRKKCMECIGVGAWKILGGQGRRRSDPPKPAPEIRGSVHVGAQGAEPPGALAYQGFRSTQTHYSDGSRF